MLKENLREVEGRIEADRCKQDQTGRRLTGDL